MKMENCGGGWIQNTRNVDDFYKKLSYITECGYSISDWVKYYYGETAVVGIHAYCEYTSILLEDLSRNNIGIEFICQGGNNIRGSQGKIVERAFNQIDQRMLKDINCIINSFISLDEQVNYLYRKHKKYNKVISLYDIVDELYYYECEAGALIRAANMVADQNREVYIFDYPRLHEQKNKTDREKRLITNNHTVSKVRKLIEENPDEAWKIISPTLNKIRDKYGDKKISKEEFLSSYPQLNKNSTVAYRYIGNIAFLDDISNENITVSNGIRIVKRNIQCSKTKRK